MSRRNRVKRQTHSGWQPLRPAEPILRTQEARDAWQPGEEMFQNDRYVVIRKEDEDGSTHLSIRRQDREPIRDWRHLQQIKNEMCGPEREGVELFPAESRLVDQSNQFHLWIAPEGVKLPIGWDAGRQVMDAPDVAGTGAKQRPLSKKEASF